VFGRIGGGRFLLPCEKAAMRRDKQNRRTAVRGRALRNSGLASQGGWVTVGSHLPSLLGDVHARRAALQHVASLVIFALLSWLCAQPLGLAERPRRPSPSHSVWRANQVEWVMRKQWDIMKTYLIVAL